MDPYAFQKFLQHSLGDLLFRLRDIEWVKGDRQGRLQQQLTSSHVMIVVTGGIGRLVLENQEYLLRRDAVYLCPPQLTFGIDAESLDELELFLLRFDVYAEAAGRIERAMDGLLSLAGEIPVRSAGQLAILCDTLQTYWQSEEGLDRFQSQLVFFELLQHLFKNQCRFAKDSRTGIELAKSYLEENFGENLTIEQLARIAQVSPKYFVDLYKKTYGISAMDYLGELRLNKAKQLMAKSHAKLRDVAHQVGYHDEFYFSRKFKKETGVSPTVYMKKRQRKIAAYHAPVIGHMLALKMIPFAAPLHPKWTAYYHKMYRNDIPVHLSAFRHKEDWEANIDTLEQTHPDLVLSLDELASSVKERLNGVAPIFYIPGTEANWREQLLMTADFLGEQAEAESWLRAYDRKAEEKRAQLQRVVKEETVAVVRIQKGHMQLHSNRSIGEVFYGDLQMNPAFLPGTMEYSVETTLHELAALDPDRLLLLVRQEAETLEFWKMLKQSSAWKELRAVRANKAYRIPSDPWREYSATAHDRMIDQAVDMLTGDRPN